MTAVFENTPPPPYYSQHNGIISGDCHPDLAKMKKLRSRNIAASQLCTGRASTPNLGQTIKMRNNNISNIDNSNAKRIKLYSNYNNTNTSENYSVYDSDNNNDSDNDNNDNDNDNTNDHDNNNDNDDYDGNNSNGNNNNNNNDSNNANGNNGNNDNNGNDRDDPNRKDNRNKTGSDRDNSSDENNDDEEDDEEKKPKTDVSLKNTSDKNRGDDKENTDYSRECIDDKDIEMSDNENEKPDIDNDNNNNKRPLSTSYSSSSSSRSWSPSSNSNRNNIFICNQISLLESNFIDSSKKRRKQLTPIRISSTQKNQQNPDEVDDDCNLKSQDKGFGSKLIMTLSVEYDGDDHVTLNYDVKDKLKALEGCQQNRPETNDTISCDDELEEGEISNKNLMVQEMSIKNDTKDVNVNKEMWSRDSVENIEKDENNLNSLSVDEIKAKSKEWLTGFSGMPFSFQRDPQQPMTALDLIPQLAMPNVQQMNQAVALENLRTNGPPFRIFNPEAYCDICNKEFCNKYFLKTHKANKHGIYEPQTTSEMQPTNQPIQIEPVFHINSLQQPNPERTPTSTTFPSNGLEIVLQNNIQNQNELATHSPNSNFPSEISLFCDLCFKRFTNIFTMRRHRLNCTEVLNSEANQDQNGSIKTDLNDISDENRSSPFKLPECFREDFSVEQEDASFTPEPRKLSPSLCQQAKEANFAYDKLKRLGVINPEAFCELCCKEYCNKYFLRTHKLKRHGILIPMDDEIQMSAAKYQSSWHYVQTSPLNLMTSTAQSSNKQFNRNFIENLPTKSNINTGPPVTVDSLVKNDKSNDKIGNKVEKDDFVSSLLLEIQLKTERKSPIQDDESENSRKTPTYQTQDSDAVSVDLQKLQSMILQLNNLNAPDITGCSICGKEMENRYALHAHMIAEHSNLNMNPEEMNDTKKFSSPCRTPTMGYTESCKYCDKEFTSISSLKQHLYEEHGYQVESPMREGFRTPDHSITNISPSPSQNERNVRPAYTITPTSSYCELCNKELCNKYFMKTHMQRMHGIEIENGAQIGGVVCNICNKELCSKYFLRVHKHNTHGVVDEGSPLPQPRQNSNEASDIDMKLCNIESSQMQFNSNNSNEMDRYFTHYTEVCPICTRRFKNAKWLQSHLASDHGRFGLEKLSEIEVKLENDLTNGNNELLNENNSCENSKAEIRIKTPTDANKHIRTIETPPVVTVQSQNIGNKNALSDIQEYYCSYCQFSTPYLTILFIHEKDHTKQFSQKQRGEDNKNGTTSRIEEQLQQYHKLSSQLLSVNSDNNSLASHMKQTPIYLPDSKLDPKLIGDINNINNNILSEVASIVQCPALYALPQKSWPMIMQSFLVEENLKFTSPEEKIAASRFVPSFIYFPVKERISNPITVSFTLTPT